MGSKRCGYLGSSEGLMVGNLGTMSSGWNHTSSPSCNIPFQSEFLPHSLQFLIIVRRPDKTAASTATPKGKYTESLTFSTPNCIYANYGKLGKPSLQPMFLPFPLEKSEIQLLQGHV